MTKPKANTIYVNWDNIEDRAVMTVDAIKVPGGVLYITAHHQWGQINSTFVKSENIIKEPKEPKNGDPEKIWEFLGPKEPVEEEAKSEH